jgi:hypothetical protein
VAYLYYAGYNNNIDLLAREYEKFEMLNASRLLNSIYTKHSAMLREDFYINNHLHCMTIPGITK